MPLKKESTLRTERITASLLVAHLLTALLVGAIAKAALGFKDASSALAFYGVYHQNPWNQLIHFCGVPFILWSIVMILAHLPLPGECVIQIPWTERHSITWATLVTVGYTLFYLSIDVVGGLLYAPIIYGMYASAVHWVAQDQEAARKKYDEPDWTGTGKILKIGLWMQFLSWYVQIHPGHAILEGAKPAVLDSFGGALTSAPLFAFYEGVWLLGINKGLQERTNQLVAEYTAELCASGAAMRVCETL